MALNNSCRSFPAEHKVIEPEVLKILQEAEGKIQLLTSCLFSQLSDSGAAFRSARNFAKRIGLLRCGPAQPVYLILRRLGL